jgi:hypothetical protein
MLAQKIALETFELDALARIMHHLPRFCMPGPHADCTRTPSIRPVWIGVRQLAVQRIGD